MERQTRRLFYENVYLKEFAAAVLTTGEDEHGTYILLDQTAFYPEEAVSRQTGDICIWTEKKRTGPPASRAARRLPGNRKI